MSYNNNSADSVGVIGGGLGGLAAACTLAARGHQVRLFESNPWLGGKAAVLSEDGFRFDMGPTILTLPSVLRRIFSEAGENIDDYVELVRLDPQWRSFFSDGTTLDLVADVHSMKSNLDQFAPGSGAAAGYERFMDLSKRLNTITDRYFFWRSVGGIRDMFDMKQSFKPGVLKDVLAMRPHSTVGRTVRSFVPDARVAQMIDHYTQYVGSSPDSSPSVLCGIANMQSNEGVWYPIGGTRAVAEALVTLADKLGVQSYARTAIRRILTQDRRVIGCETSDGQRHHFEAVVSNCDSVRTYRELIGGPLAEAFNGRRDYEPACSGVVLYLGLKERYDHLLHHNFVFSEDPHAEFDSIYQKGEPAPDPTCYVCAPSCTEPSVAPEGGEALYVLVHTPHLRDRHRWQEMLPGYRRTILEKLKRTAGLSDIEDRIVFESSLTPEDIHRRYRVLNGAIYGLASHGRLFGAFKPGNRSKDLKGLYLCGGAAHPGPGMPMVIMSGWIAADACSCDLGTNRLRREPALAGNEV